MGGRERLEGGMEGERERQGKRDGGKEGGMEGEREREGKREGGK